MIKRAKNILVASLLVGVTLNAMTLEEYNQVISTASHPDQKQTIICEREVSFFKNPQECLKSVDMLLASRKNVNNTTTYRFDFYGIRAVDADVLFPRSDILTDKEFIDDVILESYNSAGVLYGKLGQDKMKVKMYEKAIEYNPNKAFTAHFNLGVAYLYGKGVEMNKIKTYEHWRAAAKQGNSGAQENLDILCSESPWACK
jgi:tetratricopeptide (TPR) repeat protein